MKKAIYRAFAGMALSFLFAVPACAITPEEVEAAGKEAVTGNLVVWFICAIAFLKVSTKLDSILQAMGLSVGRPQGNPLTELLLAARGLGMARAILTGGLAGKPGKASDGAAAQGGLSGGLAGAVHRKLEQDTAAAISGTSTGAGLSSGVGAAMYQESLGKPDGFASHVIGSVATGQTPGVISGEAASEALGGYFAAENPALTETGGIPSSPAEMVDPSDASVEYSAVPDTPMAMENDAPIPVSPTREEEAARMAAPSGSYDAPAAAIATSQSIQEAAIRRVATGQMGNLTTDVEIGGGKITGREIIPGKGQIQFAMYNAAQFEKPGGHYTTQTSLDGQKWYKVYATSTVEKTPTVRDDHGHFKYEERKVARLPKAPDRRR